MSFIDGIRDAANKHLSTTFAALGISGSRVEMQPAITRDTKAPVHVETPIVTHAPSGEDIDWSANRGIGGQGGSGGSIAYGGNSEGSSNVQGGNIYGETAYGGQGSNEAGPTPPAL